jgi:hypothetical protein
MDPFEKHRNDRIAESLEPRERRIIYRTEQPQIKKDNSHVKRSKQSNFSWSRRTRR